MLILEMNNKPFSHKGWSDLNTRYPPREHENQKSLLYLRTNPSKYVRHPVHENFIYINVILKSRFPFTYVTLFLHLQINPFK